MTLDEAIAQELEAGSTLVSQTPTNAILNRPFRHAPYALGLIGVAIGTSTLWLILFFVLGAGLNSRGLVILMSLFLGFVWLVGTLAVIIIWAINQYKPRQYILTIDAKGKTMKTSNTTE